MTLPASGAISLQNLITEFGGGTKLTDFYRGGGLVPATGEVTNYQAWSSFEYNFLGPSPPSPANVTEGWSVAERNSDGLLISAEVYWGGAEVVSGSAAATELDDPDTGGGSGYQYQRGTLQESYDDGTFTYHYYNVRRRRYTVTTESINTDVPTSGAIFLTDFYGATS